MKGFVGIMRKSGVLLPVSSIPSPYGIGAFSKEAYAFIDLLEKQGSPIGRYCLWDLQAMGILLISLFLPLQAILIILIWKP